MKIRKTLSIAAMLCLLVTAFVTAPAISAADEGGTCFTDPERVRLYENNIGDTSDGNDTFLMCGTGIADLDARDHTSPGLCKSGNFRIGDTWNDCVSSFHAIIPSGRILCLYGAKNYGTPVVKVTYSQGNVRTNLLSGFGLNDGLSSLRFMDSSAIYCY